VQPSFFLPDHGQCLGSLAPGFGGYRGSDRIFRCAVNNLGRGSQRSRYEPIAINTVHWHWLDQVESKAQNGVLIWDAVPGSHSRGGNLSGSS
jgi:hypothetical protein